MTATPMQPNPLPLGTEVKTADGKNLGKVKEVRSDHYVVEKGLIFEEDFFIPLNAIVAVEGDTAHIGLNEADLAGAGWEEPPIYEGVGELGFQRGEVNPVTPDPFGVIATPRGEQPTVVDGLGNVAPIATTEDLSNPDQPVTDMDRPKQINREVRPGEVWQDESIAEIEPGGVDPGYVDSDGGARARPGSSTGEAFPAGTTPAVNASHASTNVPYEQRQKPYAGEPEIDFQVGMPVHSADDEHVGDVVNISPHHVMVEKSRFFGDRNFSIPKTAFNDRRGDTLYLNVPAAALGTAGWESDPYDGGDGSMIIPVPPRQLGGGS